MASTTPTADFNAAVRRFMEMTRRQYSVRDAYLFGSHARGEAHSNSDADIAVLLQGAPGKRVDEALKMADIAFDVMMETGVLVEAIPFWETEWEHPEQFNNPALIANIRRDGVRL